MGTEETVAQHYTHGALERAVLDALRAAGKDPDRLVPADLAPVDEFHIGGRQATVDFAAELRVTTTVENQGPPVSLLRFYERPFGTQ